MQPQNRKCSALRGFINTVQDFPIFQQLHCLPVTPASRGPGARSGDFIISCSDVVLWEVTVVWGYEVEIARMLRLETRASPAFGVKRWSNFDHVSWVTVYIFETCSVAEMLFLLSLIYDYFHIMNDAMGILVEKVLIMAQCSCN